MKGLPLSSDSSTSDSESVASEQPSLGWEEPSGWPEDAGRDRLIGDWHIYQRSGGHRTSTDDLIVAWYAVHRNSIADKGKTKSYLDLGCGVGSVLFMVCHKLAPVKALGVEAQAQSAAMAERAASELPAHETQLSILHSDFRSVDTLDTRFDLITGSPPYFPLNAGVLPKDAQRRACRFEARGGVEAYTEAAAALLSDKGRFYLVHQTRWADRVLSAAESCSLKLTGQADFLMRTDRSQPFLSVFEFSPQPTPQIHRFSAAVRDSNGEISAGYQEIRLELGVS